MIRANFCLSHAGQLVTMSGGSVLGARGSVAAIDDGALCALDGDIVWVGPTSALHNQVELDRDAVTINAAGRVVLPGFVDSHTHPVFADWRAGEFYERALKDTAAPAESYADQLREGRGIMRTVQATRAVSEATLLELTRDRADEFLRNGTTTIEAKSGYGLDAETEIKSLHVLDRLRVQHVLRIIPTFLGPHAVPQEFAGRASDFMEVVIDQMLPRALGLARFADVWCEHVAFSYADSRRYLHAARALGLELKLHGDELGDSGGALLAAEVGARSADHLVFSPPDAIDTLAKAGVSAVLLPGTCFFLGDAHYAPARAFLDAGVHVALATDFNPGTSPTQSMSFIMTLAVQKLRMTPEEALRAATLGGARAIGMEDEIGSLETGKRCDLAIFAADDFRIIPYRYATNLVTTVVVGGQVVVDRHGQRTTLPAPRTDRDPVATGTDR